MGHHLVEPNPWMILPFGLLLGRLLWRRCSSRNGGPGIIPKSRIRSALSRSPITCSALHAYQRDAACGTGVCQLHRADWLAVRRLGRHPHQCERRGDAAQQHAFPVHSARWLANLLGTTGASMLLIRPWIRMNRRRIAAHHIVFFIFIVSNVGGCLTPVGDPPLFLGYLKGIPFWWVAEHCWPMWAVGVGFLLAAVLRHRRGQLSPRAPGNSGPPAEPDEPWRFDGLVEYRLSGGHTGRGVPRSARRSRARP